jgi:hypothetical protein
VEGCGVVCYSTLWYGRVWYGMGMGWVTGVEGHGYTKEE